MAVILLEIARIFATKVPGKIDADVLQLLWKVFSSCGYNSKAIIIYLYVVYFVLFQILLCLGHFKIFKFVRLFI